MSRTLVAFLVAPIFPALAPAWFLHANYPDRTPVSGFIFICGLFYLLQAIIGVPAYLFARARRRYVWFYLLVGFLGPAIPFILARNLFWAAQIGISEAFLMAAYFGFLGATTGLIFWFAARPDKKVPGSYISS